MVAGTSGAGGSISRRDKGAPARRARVVQALVTQGGLVVVLLGLAWFQRKDRQALALLLATLLVPGVWGFAFWRGFARDEAARREGVWSPAFAAREAKRTYGVLGASVVAWVALALAILLLV